MCVCVCTHMLRRTGFSQWNAIFDLFLLTRAGPDRQLLSENRQSWTMVMHCLDTRKAGYFLSHLGDPLIHFSYERLLFDDWTEPSEYSVKDRKVDTFETWQILVAKSMFTILQWVSSCAFSLICSDPSGTFKKKRAENGMTTWFPISTMVNEIKHHPPQKVRFSEPRPIGYFVGTQ